MFFGNFHQTWSEFVLADLGIFRYEKVHLDESARAFQTRRQVEQFHAIYRCRELLRAGTALQDVLVAVPPPLADSAGIQANRSGIETPHPVIAAATPGSKPSAQNSSSRSANSTRSHMSCPRLSTSTEVVSTRKPHPHHQVLEKLERFADAAALLARYTKRPHASSRPNCRPAFCRA